MKLTDNCYKKYIYYKKLCNNINWDEIYNFYKLKTEKEYLDFLNNIETNLHYVNKCIKLREKFPELCLDGRNDDGHIQWNNKLKKFKIKLHEYKHKTLGKLKIFKIKNKYSTPNDSESEETNSASEISNQIESKEINTENPTTNEKTDSESEKTDSESEKTDSESEKTDSESEKTNSESEKTDSESEKTDSESEKTDSDSFYSIDSDFESEYFDTVSENKINRNEEFKFVINYKFKNKIEKFNIEIYKGETILNLKEKVYDELLLRFPDNDIIENIQPKDIRLFSNMLKEYIISIYSDNVVINKKINTKLKILHLNISISASVFLIQFNTELLMKKFPNKIIGEDIIAMISSIEGRYLFVINLETIGKLSLLCFISIFEHLNTNKDIKLEDVYSIFRQRIILFEKNINKEDIIIEPK
jgi:hypothetical protein